MQALRGDSKKEVAYLILRRWNKLIGAASLRLDAIAGFVWITYWEIEFNGLRDVRGRARANFITGKLKGERRRFEIEKSVNLKNLNLIIENFVNNAGLKKKIE